MMFPSENEAIRAGDAPLNLSRGAPSVRGGITIRFVAMAIVSAAYLISFFLPVYEWEGEGRPYSGWEAFISPYWVTPFLFRGNWFGSAVYLVGWLPNALLLIGLVYLSIGYERAAAYAGVVAVLLAAIVWSWLEPNGEFAGYYLWMASMILLALPSLRKSVRPLVGRTFSRAASC